MAGQDSIGQGGKSGQADDVRDMLRNLATQIKDQIADAEHRQHTALADMQRQIQKRPAPVTEDDPWDTASAEALTRLYDSEAPVTAPPIAASPARPAVPTAAPAKAAPRQQPIYFADPPVEPKPAARPPAMQRVAVQRPTDPKPAAPMPKAAPAPVASVATPMTTIAAAAAPLAAMAMPAPAALAWLASDRDWLDQRLADLQSRVADTLSSFDPAPITARIDALDTRMTASLADLPRKADLARLATLETDVTAIKSHVEAARDSLKRLDSIETNLKDLQALAASMDGAEVPADTDASAPNQRLDQIEQMVRALHDYAAEQQAQPVAAMPDMPDVHGLAEKAADRAAAHVVEQYKDLFSPAKRAEFAAQTQATSGASLEDMTQLLDAFAEDQRREQSETAATLTTMQEALIRLIDRIEELTGDGSQPVAEAPSNDAPRFVEVQDERDTAPGRRAGDRTAPPAELIAAPIAAAATAAPAARATRTPRVAEPVQAAAPVDDAAAAAEAMAAERARVQAERAAARRAPTPRPQVAAAPEPEAETPAADAAPAKAPRATRAPANKSMLKRAMLPAAAGAVCVIAGAIAYTMLGKSNVNAKLGDRVPAPLAAPANPAAATAVRAPAARPAIPTETPAAGQAKALPTPTPTPALPEAAPRDPRPQPAAGTAQPAPREAPPPQVAPQGRAVDAPTIPAGRRRGTPETVTDDLSSNTQTPDQADRVGIAEVAAARVTTAAVHGIALDGTGAMPDPAELARRQARLAPVEIMTAPPIAPQSNTPLSNTIIPPPAGDPLADATISKNRPELPPANIGPMSMRVAAQQGDPAAAFEVAVRFAEAKGVKQDFQQALVWYSRAAQVGFIPAQYRLATIYEGGLHGTQDLPRAKVWYKRAADQGNVKAMHNLAVLAAGNGQGQADYQTASRWFAEAAERGLADSQYNLGVLHESGLGVAKDPLQAYKWFALAARSGDKEAGRRRDQLMASFTPQAAQAAEKIVQSWRARPTDLKANDARAAAQSWQVQQARLIQQAQAQMQAQQTAQQPATTVEAKPEAPVTPTKAPAKATIRATPQR